MGFEFPGRRRVDVEFIEIRGEAPMYRRNIPLLSTRLSTVRRMAMDQVSRSLELGLVKLQL